MGQREKALALLEKAKALDSSKYKEEYQELLKKAEEADPNAREIFLLLGLFYYREEKWKEAVENLARYISMDYLLIDDEKKAQSIYLCHIKCCQKAGRKEESIRYIKNYIGIFPDSATAASLVEQVFKKFPQKDEWLKNLQSGSRFYRSADYEASIKAFDRALELNKKFPWADYCRGLCFMKLSRFEKAIESFRSALSIEAEFLFSYQLASAYKTLGKFKEAESHFNDTLAHNPYHIPSMVSLAEIHAEERRIDAAKEMLQKTLDIERDGPCAKRAKGLLDSIRDKTARQEIQKPAAEKIEHVEIQQSIEQKDLPKSTGGKTETKEIQKPIEPDLESLRDGIIKSAEEEARKIIEKAKNEELNLILKAQEESWNILEEARQEADKDREKLQKDLTERKRKFSEKEKEITSRARAEAKSIRDEAKKEAGVIVDKARSDAKTMIENASQEKETFLEKAHIEVKSIIIKAEKEAGEILGKARAEASSIIDGARREGEFIIKEAGSRRDHLMKEAEERAQKLMVEAQGIVAKAREDAVAINAAGGRESGPQEKLVTTMSEMSAPGEIEEAVFEVRGAPFAPEASAPSFPVGTIPVFVEDSKTDLLFENELDNIMVIPVQEEPVELVAAVQEKPEALEWAVQEEPEELVPFVPEESEAVEEDVQEVPEELVPFVPEAGKGELPDISIIDDELGLSIDDIMDDISEAVEEIGGTDDFGFSGAVTEKDQKAGEEAVRKAGEEAVRKAGEEAVKKAGEEAVKKAEEEARKRAEEEEEEEADRKAQEEQEKKAEEEAQKRAGEEARKKTVEDERRKLIEDARKKGEEEAAKKKADEAALRKERERKKADISTLSESDVISKKDFDGFLAFMREDLSKREKKKASKPGKEVADLLKKAGQFYDVNEWDKAKELYLEVMKTDRDNEEACSRLSEIYAIRGLLNDVVSQNCEFVRILYENGNTEKALEIAGKTQGLDTEGIMIRMSTLFIYRKEGEADKIVSVGLDFARLCSERGQGDRCIDMIGLLQELYPENSDVGLRLADSFMMEGNMQEALSQFKLMGEKFLELGNKRKALEAYKKVKVLTTPDKELHLVLGNLYRETGDLDAAETEFRAALRFNIMDVEALSALGQVSMDKGAYRDAILAYNKVLQIDPGAIFAKEQIGHIHKNTGNKDLAIRSFMEAAGLYAQGGSTEKAIEAYKMILEIDPDHIDAMNALDNLR